MNHPLTVVSHGDNEHHPREGKGKRRDRYRCARPRRRGSLMGGTCLPGMLPALTRRGRYPSSGSGNLARTIAAKFRRSSRWFSSTSCTTDRSTSP